MGFFICASGEKVFREADLMYEDMGYCGIDCSNCEIKKAALDPKFADKLVQEWRKSNPDANRFWFRCLGCKGKADVCWGADCGIRICADNKGVEHCAQCPEFKCSLIIKFENDEHRHHTDAIRKLEGLHEKT